MERASLLRRMRTWLGVIVLLGMSLPIGAQQQAPTLGEILQRLQANLNHYDEDVPSVFCDERLVSSRVEPHVRDLYATTDSVFRLKRISQDGSVTTLEESREVKSVDGRAPSSHAVQVPALLTGIFEGGLAVVSVEQTSCMNYKLERSKVPGEMVIRFATVLTPSNTPDCLLQEKSKGKAVVDVASMQVKHVEIDTPAHVIDEGDRDTGPTEGRRELTVDYAPVLLGKDTFWMPSAVGMRTSTGSSFDTTVWTFQATYRNYHRLEVSSRILSKPEE